MHLAAFTIKRAHLRTIAISSRLAKLFDLTPARYDILYEIHRGIAQYQRDLWRHFHVSRTTISRMLIALEQLDLITRERVPGRASLRLRLTVPGARLVKAAIRYCHRPMLRLFESLFPTLAARGYCRAIAVDEIRGYSALVAVRFGDRSVCGYSIGHPDD